MTRIPTTRGVGRGDVMSDDGKDDDEREEGLRPILELLPPLPPRPKPNHPHLGRLDEFVSTDDDPTGIVYQHSVLCQTFLPYRDPGPDVRTWERSNGFLNLKVVAGDSVDPATRRLCRRRSAVRSEGAARALSLERRGAANPLAGHRARGEPHEVRAAPLRLSSDGRTIAAVKDQLTRLAAADFRVLMRKGDEAHVLKGTFVERFSLWAPRDGSGADRTPTTVQLSQPYFESLLSRAVPLNESAVWCLSHNAMAMDIYAWLAQRLHRIDPEKGEVLVPWPRLHEQFGSAYARLRKFREVLGPTLAQVKAVYPQAKYSLDRRGMMLRHSRSPVAKRRFVITSPE